MRYIQILSLLACAQVAVANPISLQARAIDATQSSQSNKATQLYDNPGKLDAKNPSQDRMEDTRNPKILPRITDPSNAALDAMGLDESASNSQNTVSQAGTSGASTDQGTGAVDSGTSTTNSVNSGENGNDNGNGNRDGNGNGNRDGNGNGNRNGGNGNGNRNGGNGNGNRGNN